MNRKTSRRALLSSFPVVLDACVLCDSNLRDIVLEAASFALYRPIWSRDILNEVRNTLFQKLKVPQQRVDYLCRTMEEAFPEAEVDGYAELTPAMTNDPKDRHVLAAAVAANAQVIVTGNTRHFPEEALEPHGVEVLNADDFLRDLLDMDAEHMTEALATIASRRKMPPKTPDEILTALERACPGFVADMRAHLAEVFKDK